MLSLSGVLNSITVITVFAFGSVFGLWVVVKSRKLKSRLLTAAGLTIFGTGFLLLTSVIDIFTVFITGYNMDNSLGLHGIFIYMGGPVLIICALYISGELLMPKKKWYLIPPFVVLSFICELILFLDYDNSIIVNTIPGEHFLHSGLVFGSPLFWIMTILMLSVFIFNGIGLLIKGIQSKAEIRKKYLILSFAFILYLISSAIDVNRMISMELNFIIKISIIISQLLFYFGLKPKKPSKPKRKIPSEEERKFASYLLGKPKAIDQGEIVDVSNLKLEKDLLIFISYATKDVDTFKVHDIAKKLTEFPEIENVLYWEEHMEDNIFEYMDENLSKCDVMILFCSEKALESVPVKKEWTAA
ncbi:MAG: toll/interleukin-1 receptor domain-containing protein, partial [Candidatus Thorarchaeota archaeon]